MGAVFTLWKNLLAVICWKPEKLSNKMSAQRLTWCSRQAARHWFTPEEHLSRLLAAANGGYCWEKAPEH